MTCKARLEKYFHENHVPFESMTHPEAYSAQAVAQAQHVSGHQVAKTVMVLCDGQLVMLVLPASYSVSLDKATGVLDSKSVHFARETEFRHLFPDCEVGAMPPFGNLYDIPVYVDRSLTAGRDIVFRAGTHQDTMRSAYADYARLAKPTVAHFAELS